MGTNIMAGLDLSEASLSFQNLCTTWDKDREFPPFHVKIAGRDQPIIDGWRLELSVFDGNGVDGKGCVAIPQGLRFTNGVCEVAGFRFTEVSSKCGGHFTLHAWAVHPMDQNITIGPVKSEKIVIKSGRSYSTDKGADHPKAGDPVSSLAGISKAFIKAFEESGVTTIVELAAMSDQASAEVLKKNPTRMNKEDLRKFISTARELVAKPTAERELASKSVPAQVSQQQASANDSADKRDKAAQSAWTDELDAQDFNAVAYINKHFPDEGSLARVESFMDTMRQRVTKLDNKIVTAIREQGKSGKKAKDDLRDAEAAIQELFGKLVAIKEQSQASESMVQEICRDIKALDYAKTHLTSTITTLKRLQMLVTAVDQLKAMATSRQYLQAANLLEATKQLSVKFNAYRKIPKIAELQDQIQDVEDALHRQVFDEIKNGINVPRDALDVSLSDACRLVDAMGPQARHELVSWYSSVQFAAYRNAFQAYGEAGTLDKTEKRYAWMKKLLKQFDEDHSNIFPNAWQVDLQLCEDFIDVTAKHLKDILEHEKATLDVGVFMHNLEKTVQFERELEQRFTLDTEDEVSKTETPKLDVEQPSGDVQGTDVIRLRYQEFKKQSNKPKPHREGPGRPKVQRKWNGISQTFEPYMNLYIENEDKNLQQTVVKLMSQETWVIPDGTMPKVIQSSTNLVLNIKKVLRRCSSYTRGPKLLSLHMVFKKTLTSYAEQLTNSLPSGTPLSSGDEERVCFIANTAGYCYDMAQQLCDSVQRIAEEVVRESIDVETEKDAFHAVSTKAIKTLVGHVSFQLNNAFEKMVRMNWNAIEDVGDSSEFVSDMGVEFGRVMPTFCANLSQTYLDYLCDSLVTAFCERYVANIYKCRRISEMAAQQLLLDTKTLGQHVLAKLPIMGARQDDVTSAAPTVRISFKSFVSKEMGKVEGLIKVVGTPVDATVSTFMTLLPEGTNFEFQRILDLKGLKKTEISALSAQLTEARNKQSTLRSRLETPH
eukprot:c13815_g1_i3.p1 GENE.c13815_g1_i3~~c13815_g1_i3.p1  ORF type:complete len:998 (+),score=255.91 c13815_g1_i3:1-2994(+)